MTDSSPLYPLLLQPRMHVKVWGGRRLETVLGKSLETDQPYGESWELHDTAIVANGSHAGRTLGSVLTEYGTDLVGEGSKIDEGFPLLAKFIDASQWLSVQVHPDDEQAWELEGDPRGKTEAWVILAAEPDAKLVIGVKPGAAREDVARAIQEQTLEEILMYEHVRAGDMLFIPANTIHAIGPGVLLYEIQQSSDVTYRLYDWGRMGLDGKPRELHIKKGVQVANVDTLPAITRPESANGTTLLIESEYFQTVLHRLDKDMLALFAEGRFHALTCIDGETTVGANGVYVQMQIGQTVLIPASVDEYTLSGTAKVLDSFQGNG